MYMYKGASILLVSILLVSCKSSKEFVGFDYDPPDVTNTTDKEVLLQHRRTIGAGTPRVWINNEFSGARASDFYAVNDSVFEVFVEPENNPINNSPWYAFKIWSDTVRAAKIRLNYRDATHRYTPKLLSFVQADSTWQQQWELPVKYDTANGTGTFEVLLAPDPVIISAQPLYTYTGLLDTLAHRNITEPGFTNIFEVGKSHGGRTIWELDITEVQDEQPAPVLVILGRQHPPEVTGFKASLYFLEELTADTPLAKTFRNTFVVKSFPMVNPDGVEMGNWRSNAAGIDLNRDWKNFNQPEPRAVRAALAGLTTNPKRSMFYAIDFHSTGTNIFYPIDEEVKTIPDNITQKWAAEIIAEHPEVSFDVEEFDTSSPIAKNWFYHTFGIDALTYEVGDDMKPAKLEEVSRSAAQSLMELLLAEYHKSALEN
jgi:hypothetical protein